MRRSLFLIIFMVSIYGFPSNPDHSDKGKKYPSVYKEGIIVNGNSHEWEPSLFGFKEDAHTNYAIVNDSAALYVCIRMADEPQQMKALSNGMEILINSKGKKKPEATLQFPIGKKMNPELRRDRKTTHLMYLLQMQDMDLTGFREGINGFQKIKSGKSGITVALNWDSANVMVYEARIPFQCFATDVRNAEPLSVGIIIKGAPKPKEGEGSGTAEGNPSDMQGGRGHERPGSMPQDGMGMDGETHSMGGNMKMFEDDEIWRHIEVAKKK
ncbi:MAG: hypothetical protein NTU98_11375 [Bacteroidetes bacterium]|nr:hypothetical protein [Bacteroidota bacterium]